MNPQVKNRVLKYVCEHPGASDDKIAEDLKIHVVDVLSALVVLEEEGKVKSVN